MTCIVGLVDETGVYMGADSSSASGWEVRSTKLPKVFKIGEFTIGYTTSFRMGQLLQHKLQVKPQGEETDIAYMVSSFVEAVRNCLKEHGFSKVENNKEEGGAFLVAYRGNLYSIHDDFQVNEMTDGLDACGCGREYALGAMRASEHQPPKDRIEQALSIAAYFSGGVLPPFVVLKVE
jgi:ATP-dependent protease HslVU (ClpYQ) peptidase subunit